MSSTLVLLSTSDCSLCEDAQRALMAMPQAMGQLLEVRDIATSAELIESHGERIPVLRMEDEAGICRGELDWPFSGEDLAALLISCSAAS